MIKLNCTLLACLWMLSACASARIEIQSDYYGETPVVDKARQQRSLAELGGELIAEKNAAYTLLDEYTETLDLLANLSPQYTGLTVLLNAPADAAPPTAGEVKSAEDFDLGELSDQRSAFLSALDKAKEGVASDFEAAQKSIAEYQSYLVINDLSPSALDEGVFNARTELASNVKKFTQSVRKSLVGLRATDYATFLLVTFPGAVEAAEQGIARRRAAGTLTKDIKAKYNKIRRQVSSASDKISALHAKISSSSGRQTGTSDPVARLVANMRSLEKSNTIDTHRRFALRDFAIVQDFYNSQVDRLQDPADPAWREILKEQNDPKWIEFFGKTVFYAQGKAEVVIVRDRPGHYRVQRAVNNPAVLIKNQLEVSRAVASAATTVLAGTTGIQTGAPTQSDSPPLVMVENESLASLNGRLDAEAQLRASTSLALVPELRRSVAELEALAQPDLAGHADRARRDEIYEALRTSLTQFSEVRKYTGRQVKGQ